MSNMNPRYNTKHYNQGSQDYAKGVRLCDCPFVGWMVEGYNSWRAGWRDASKQARRAKLPVALQRMSVNSGDHCKWRDADGHIERDVVSSVYTSAMGHLCAEMKSGRKVKISELFDVKAG